MTRRVDEKKTRKALARLRRAKRKSEEQGEGEEISLSEWEAEFIASVEERLEEYGSAFANPEKGDLSEPLSALQNHKVKEIHKKASGKARKPMKRGGGLQARIDALHDLQDSAPQKYASRGVQSELQALYAKLYGGQPVVGSEGRRL